jgi:hypothetical protein
MEPDTTFLLSPTKWSDVGSCSRTYSSGGIMRSVSLPKLSFSPTKSVWVAAGAAAVAGLLVLGACSDSVTSKIAAPKDLTPRFGIVGDQAHIVQVCVDPGSSVGTYQFVVARMDSSKWPYPSYESQNSHDGSAAYHLTGDGPFRSTVDNDVITPSVFLAKGSSVVCANVFVRATFTTGVPEFPVANGGNRLWSQSGRIVNPPASVNIHPVIPAGFSYTVSCHNDDLGNPQDTATEMANATAMTGLPPVCTNGADGTLNMHSSANVFHGSTLTYTFTAPPVTPCPAGSFSFSFDGSGNLNIVYDQFPAPNDNSYGVNAVGWGTKGHTFGNLTGSDKAGIQLRDAGGIVRLSFNMDYMSAKTGTPSGYASLGVTGGDGSMVVGTAAGITVTTSLAKNLNGPDGLSGGGFCVALNCSGGGTNLLVDSPPTVSNTSYDLPAGSPYGAWDFHDTYFATISAAKLAAIGFNAGTWTVEPNLTVLHNSPSKPCPDAGGACNVAVTKTETRDKQVKITIRNNGTSDTFLTGLDLTWPQGTNGNLTQIKLDGDVIYNGPAISGGTANLLLADLVADQNRRKIKKNSSDVLTLIFANNVSSTLSNYTGTAHFGDTCELTILP